MLFLMYREIAGHICKLWSNPIQSITSSYETSSHCWVNVGPALQTYIKDWLRGLVKLKKSKNPRKTPIVQIPSTTRLSIFFIYFGNMYNEKNNTKKHNISKKKSELGLEPPTRPPTFSRIFGFFLT